MQQQFRPAQDRRDPAAISNDFQAGRVRVIFKSVFHKKLSELAAL
jgi:hypothetical protein